MPLKAGTDRATMAANAHELRHGKMFARTAKKFGKARARKQMIAIMLSKARESAASHHAKQHAAMKMMGVPTRLPGM